MNLLLMNLLICAAIGFVEWALALRRTLACARGETSLLVGIVFVEQLLGFWVLSRFLVTGSWLVAVAYSIGAALGALTVSKKEKSRQESKSVPA